MVRGSSSRRGDPVHRNALAGFPTAGGIDVGISAVPYTGGAVLHPTVFDIDLYAEQNIVGNKPVRPSVGSMPVKARTCVDACNPRVMLA